MSLSNCSRCGRMFQRTAGSRVCFDCKEAEELTYRQVRDYLEMHPGSDIGAVAAGTGIDEAIVLKLLQDGRLVALGDLTSGMAINCQRCSGPTTSGRYCLGCVEAIGSELKASAQLLTDTPESTKLRHPDRFKKNVTVIQVHGRIADNCLRR